MKKSTIDPSEYITTLPDSIREDMETLDREISKVMNDHPRIIWQGVFWGGSEQNIIGYGDITYKRSKGDVEWFIVGLALQKNYISIYVNAVEDQQYISEKYASKLGKVKVGKSSISFKKLADVELNVLLKLISRAKEIMTAERSK